MIQNPVDLAQSKTSTVSEVQSLPPCRRSHDCPPTSPYGVSRSQSALCCSVLFTLFVVLNLIVINIFDLLCIWQAYLWEKKCFVWLVLSFWNVLIIPLFWDFPPSFKKQYFKKKKEKKKEAKVQFYCTGAKNRFCVDNQWCLGLKSQTNKRWYLRWRDLSCKEKYSLVA